MNPGSLNAFNFLASLQMELVYPSPFGGGGVYQECWGRISSCEEGKLISWLWEEYNVEKRERGKQYQLPYNIEAVEKTIKSGEGDGIFEEENQ